MKIEALAAGQIVPPFEVLDATNKKVLDGWHAIAYYWVGKNPAAALFAAPPGGPFGMDHMDYLGWLYVGGGLQMWRDFYQNDLKLNVILWPAHPSSPQAFGWFKKPLRSVADLKGLKCRQTGLNAEVYAKLGMAVVNMAGGEIVPAAQRGVIDCAEWVGGVEDLRLGLHSVFKYHYTPGMHENNSIGEFGFNLDVWKGFTPAQQEAVELGGEGHLHHLDHALAEAERRRHRGDDQEARRADPPHAARHPDRLAQGLGRGRGRELGQEPDLQEGLRVAARVRRQGGAGQALHVPAVLVRRELLLAAGKRQACRKHQRQEQLTRLFLAAALGAPPSPPRGRAA